MCIRDSSFSIGFHSLFTLFSLLTGIFVALCLRYDVRQGKNTSVFYWTFFGYVLGLATTVGVMHVFKAAQPALLYIVPANILTASIGAMIKNKFGDLWAYEEEAPAEEGKEGEAKATAASDTKKDK